MECCRSSAGLDGATIDESSRASQAEGSRPTVRRLSRGGSAIPIPTSVRLTGRSFPVSLTAPRSAAQASGRVSSVPALTSDPPAPPPSRQQTPSTSASTGAGRPGLSAGADCSSSPAGGGRVELCAGADPPSTRQMSDATDFAMALIDSSGREPGSPRRRERLLEMAQAMVTAITQAREADIAAHRASDAAREAELASIITRRTVLEVEQKIRSWANGR